MRRNRFSRRQYVRAGFIYGMIITCLVLSIVKEIRIKDQHNTILKLQDNIEALKQSHQFPNKYVGRFGVTFYCDCPICTGTAKGSRTATGHKPREGRTIAVDPKIIPLHSIVYVEGLGYFVAEDVGGAVKKNHIDIYMDDHKEATKLGTLGGKTKRVWVLK